jgi:succinate dehydrogenase / fumarate reductase, membrane anchor subunit
MVTRQAKATGSAHHGLSEWLLMRLSATYMAGFALYMVGFWTIAGVPDFNAWRAWFEIGVVQIGWAVFFAALLLHAWSGMRSVFMDYVNPLALRFAVSALTGVGLLALALWAASILIKVRP